MVSPNGCTRCGKCLEACPYGGSRCTACGRCVEVCSLRLRKICGIEYTAWELAARLNRDKEFLKKNGGGVTFSGGEALAQPLFLKEVLRLLPDMHKAVETSGYCEQSVFREIAGLLDYVIMDVKLADDELHQRYTGVSNRRILENLDYLKKGGKPYVIRVPLIPGVNDTDENLSRTAELLDGARDLERVELLPYHTTAGAKYSMVGREYTFEVDAEREGNANVELFRKRGIECRVL